MALPRSATTLRAAVTSCPIWNRPIDALHLVPAPSSPILTFLRHATHKAQGSVNGARDGPGKRLGAKKTGEQYVVPGNIIFRQRGTHWFPGENVGMGRDHTIYAQQAGYVKYYRDPARHPKRQYIGVVFERGQTLPYPRNAPRQRRLGMVAVPMEEKPMSATELVQASTKVVREFVINPRPPVAEAESSRGSTATAGGKQRKSVKSGEVEIEKVLRLRPGYMYREGNWEIGRAAEKANIRVREYRRGDRFLAWRKRVARIARNIEKKAMFRKAGKKKAGKIKK